MNSYQYKIIKPWGYEMLLTPTSSPVTAKVLHLNKGCRFSLQYHETKEECLVLTKGKANIISGSDENNLTNEEMVLNHGYFINKGTIHRCEAITDCDIFEASTPEIGKTIRLQDDYQRPDETEEDRSKRF